MKKIFTLLFAATIFLSSCEENTATDEAGTTEEGPADDALEPMVVPDEPDTTAEGTDTTETE